MIGSSVLVSRLERRERGRAATVRAEKKAISDLRCICISTRYIFNCSISELSRL
jgi:hypothetical protein